MFLNSTYKVPGPVLAREKTGYIPDAIKEADSKNGRLIRRNSWGTALFRYLEPHVRFLSSNVVRAHANPVDMCFAWQRPSSKDMPEPSLRSIER